jgi:non-heme chloroperoxidase
VPTLISHGASDAIVTFGVSGRRSHETIADSSLVLIEGAPHGFNAAPTPSGSTAPGSTS